jgi:orotate phosphoribosyltransferase
VYQIPVISIITLQNLIDYMKTQQQIDQTTLDRLLAYRQHYGV